VDGSQKKESSVSPIRSTRLVAPQLVAMIKLDWMRGLRALFVLGRIPGDDAAEAVAVPKTTRRVCNGEASMRVRFTDDDELATIGMLPPRFNGGIEQHIACAEVLTIDGSGMKFSLSSESTVAVVTRFDDGSGGIADGIPLITIRYAQAQRFQTRSQRNDV